MWHSGIDWYPGKVYMHLVYLMSQEKKKGEGKQLTAEKCLFFKILLCK